MRTCICTDRIWSVVASMLAMASQAPAAAAAPPPPPPVVAVYKVEFNMAVKDGGLQELIDKVGIIPEVQAWIKGTGANDLGSETLFDFFGSVTELTYEGSFKDRMKKGKHSGQLSDIGGLFGDSAAFASQTGLDQCKGCFEGRTNGAFKATSAKRADRDGIVSRSDDCRTART